LGPTPAFQLPLRVGGRSCVSDQPNPSPAGGTPLEFCDTIDLLDEVARRFPYGILYLERPGMKEDGSVIRQVRSWGNAVWCVGAANALVDEARAMHDAYWDDAEEADEDD
jgi:hypothetical protein